MPEQFPLELKSKHLEKAKQLQIFPQDIQEHFILGTGKGGQKINKTANCVVLKHQPTGVMIRCQQHREQSKNRLTAYRLLIEKMEEILNWKHSEKAKKRFKIRKQKQRRSKKAKEKIGIAKRERATLKETRKPISFDARE